MTARREQLLAAAAVLFADKGYHAVGMDDIGGAAGITGPGVYRHFASKSALLEALCARAVDGMLDGAREVLLSPAPPEARVARLLDLHARFAVRERALLGVWAREARALPERARRPLRGPTRAYASLWRQAVAPLRPDLGPDELAVVVNAALGLLNGAGLHGPALPDEALAALLARLAAAVLTARSDPRPPG